MVFVQIVPEYPPQVGGVSSYAAKVADGFQNHEKTIHTIVTHNEHSLRSTDMLSRLSIPTKEKLQNKLEELQTTCVLLHFSGYGYARWGLCYWLVDSLFWWKQRKKNRKLITLFHEVYASGPIWRASFWTSPYQQQIAKGLARLSDVAFVTSQGGYNKLKLLLPELSLEILPVFSNVGEPAKVLSLSHREGIAVVFGGAGRRSSTYRVLANQTSDLIAGFNKLGIHKVIDIGPGDCSPKEIAGFPIHVLGTLSEETISDKLQYARVGLLAYPLHMLTKSGILAAYWAHGLLTVNVSSVGNLPNDLKEGREFLNLKRFGNGNFEAQNIASSGFLHYQHHRSSTIVQRLMLESS
jgi:hypothetical protein